MNNIEFGERPSTDYAAKADSTTCSMNSEAVQAHELRAVADFREAILRSTKAIANEFKGAPIGQVEALARIVSAGVSLCFDSSLTNPRDRESAIAAKFWSSLLDWTRNPRIKASACVPWITPAELTSLSSEAFESPLGSSGANFPSLGKCTEFAATWIANNEPFFEWAEDALEVKIQRKATLSYLNYSGVGHHCRAHIDRPDNYEYICLLCLGHTTSSELVNQSQLRLFFKDQWRGYKIPVGGAVVFHSSSTIHGRTPIGEEESMVLLAIGLCEASK